MWVRRGLPAAVATTMFLAVAILWLTGARESYRAFFVPFGVASFRFPFLDIHGLLAAIQCHGLGVDVYAINPCDVFGRVHDYSPLWLHLAVLPITTAWTAPVGLTMDILFLCSLITLPPAQRLIGAVINLAAAVSPAVVYALERANTDVMMFLLAAVTGHLVIRSQRFRTGACVTIVVAAALKYYPVTLLILSARERWQRCLIIMTVSLAAIMLCLLPEQASLLRGLRLIPTGEADTFGAQNVPAAFVHALNWPPWSRIPVQGVAVVLMATAATTVSRRLRPGLRRLPEASRVFLIVGAALIVGCFLTGQSIGYRAIHLLFAVPALLTLATDTPGYLTCTAVALVIWVMWAVGLPLSAGFAYPLLWVTDQYAWWIVVTILSGALLAIIRDSVALKTMLESLRADPEHGAPVIRGLAGLIRRHVRPSAPP